MSRPKTRYAKSGDVSIAYQVTGDGPFDLVLVPGFASHLELDRELPQYMRFVERLSAFSRLILFDKRGIGMSDPVEAVPTLEDRMDDVRAVMDAAGSERAALFGISEGAPMAILFAASHPERTTALVLCGGMARSTWAEDYPWAAQAEDLRAASVEFIAPYWGEGSTLEIFAPSLADDPQAREFMGRHERHAASPRMALQIFEMFLDIDVRSVLPSINVPTLVLHRRGDRVVNRRAGEWLAGQISGARYVELQGVDHLPWIGDTDSALDHVEEFLTGERRARLDPDRLLATVMFADIVGSTQRASEMGDRRWRDLLGSIRTALGQEFDRYRGREIKTMGDGWLATFDGPARAIRCGRAIVDAVVPLGVELRVGLHAGEVEVMGDDVGGIAVHIAARVGALAGAGQVLVSSTVKDLVVGSGIAFAERGTYVLKGLPDEWRLFSAEG